MVNPPRAGDPSYESFEAERTGILSSLRRRALKLSDAFNKLDGVSCQTPQGMGWLSADLSGLLHCSLLFRRTVHFPFHHPPPKGY